MIRLTEPGLPGITRGLGSSMASLDLKPTSKVVRDYYVRLEEFHKIGVTHETAVRAAFQRLLEHCCRKAGWIFVEDDMICPPTGPRNCEFRAKFLVTDDHVAREREGVGL